MFRNLTKQIFPFLTLAVATALTFLLLLPPIASPAGFNVGEDWTNSSKNLETSGNITGAVLTPTTGVYYNNGDPHGASRYLEDKAYELKSDADYSSLSDAVSDIGSTKTVLRICSDDVLPDGQTISTPSTLVLDFTCGGSVEGTSGGFTETLNVSGPVIATPGRAVFGTNLTVNLTYSQVQAHESWFHSLSSAISAIGSTNSTLALDSDGNITSDVTVPTNVALVGVKGYAQAIPAKTAVSGESIGTGDGATLTFSGTLADPPLKQGSVTVHYVIGSTSYTAVDDSVGDLAGTDCSGTIDYTSGAWELTFTVAPDSLSAITMDYTPVYQLTLNGYLNAGLFRLFSGDGHVVISQDSAYPEWFGAVGDGVSDDTSACQLAIDSASTVVFSSSYLLTPNTSGKDIKNSTTDACRALKIVKSNQVLVFTADGEFVVDADDSSLGQNGWAVVAIEGASDLKVKGIKIVSTGGTTPADYYVVGISIGRPDTCSRILIKDPNIKYMGIGILCQDSTNVRIRGGYIYNCRAAGFEGIGSCVGCTVEDASVIGCGDGNCVFYGTGTTGECGMRGCYFSGTSQVCVLESTYHSFIEDCTFDGSDGSVNFGPIVNRSEYASVQNNLIVGVEYGIVVRETDVVDAGGIPNWACIVAGNRIFDTQVRGLAGQAPIAIWLERGSQILVSDNIISGTTTESGGLTPCEIRLTDMGTADPSGYQLEQVTIVNNVFVLAHVNVGPGAYIDTHYVLRNSTGHSIKGLVFSGNSITAVSGAASYYLLDLGDVYFARITDNNFVDDDTLGGPAQVISGNFTRSIISNNNLPYNGGNCLSIKATNTIISNNVSGNFKAVNPGYFLELLDGSDGVVITGNVVNGCSAFILGGSTTIPTKCIVKNNIVDYDFASDMYNMGDVSNVISDNIETNY